MGCEGVGNPTVNEAFKSFHSNTGKADWSVICMGMCGPYLKNGSDVRAFPVRWEQSRFERD